MCGAEVEELSAEDWEEKSCEEKSWVWGSGAAEAEVERLGGERAQAEGPEVVDRFLGSGQSRLWLL